jgi:hypothetical protein
MSCPRRNESRSQRTSAIKVNGRYVNETHTIMPSCDSSRHVAKAGSASRESVTAHGSDAEVSTVEDAEPKKRARKSETSKVLDKDGETIKKLKVP